MGEGTDGPGRNDDRRGTHRVTMSAPAKLTTELRVVGVRADGYHLIEAHMVSLSLADTVTFAERIGGEGIAGDPSFGNGSQNDSATARLSVGGPFSAGVPLDASNLVARALRLVGRPGWAVRINKQIPHGGGLGGGSSDAAAVLRWAGFHDLVAASELGADIPFCMVGGRARVTGIGEFVEPLDDQPMTYTIVVPPFGVSTPAVYRAWDELGGPTGDNGNDLEPAALAVEPRLGAWRRAIIEASGTSPRLAGSGSTWFLDGAHNDLADKLPMAFVTVVVTQPRTTT